MAVSVPSVPARFSASPFAHLKAKKDETPSDIDDDDDDDETDDDGDDEEAKAKKARKKAKKKAEDADDEADESKSDARVARQRERARIRTIVNSSAGKRSPAAALHLALTTAMPRHSAIALLTSMNENPQSVGDTLRDRMAGTAQPDVGVGAAQSHTQGGSAGLAAAIIAAGRKRRGEV